MGILISVGLLILSFYLLAIIVDEFFVESLDILAHKMRLSSEVAGATFMAIGSSSPELFTSLFAVLRGGAESDIGAGTIVGSAIFNILVIIGASAMFKKAVLTWQPVMRDLVFYCLSIILLLFSFLDGKIVFFEAILFVALYAVYVFSVTHWSKWFKYEIDEPSHDVVENKQQNFLHKNTANIVKIFIPKHYFGAFLMSVALIGGLSFMMVESAVHLAHTLHISPAIIGLTVLAVGTSVPDLMSSIVVAKQGRGDMAIANGVGSNIFDILIGLGVPWMISIYLLGNEVVVGTENLMSSVFLLFATVIAVLFILIVRKWEIGKRAGFILVLLYVFYIIYNVFQIV